MPKTHAHHRDGEDETTHFLLEIAEASQSPLDLDEVLERIAGVVKKAIDYRILAILLLNDRTQELRIRYDVGHPPEAKKLRVKVGQGITGQAAARRCAVNVPDVRKFEGYIHVVEHVRSELAVPMILNERVVGVIDIQSDQPNAFSPRDVELVELVAARVAILVENARLFRSTVRQAKTMETLIAISRELTGLLRVDELLPKIAEMIRRLVGYDAFTLMRLDEERQVLDHYFGLVFDKRVKERGVIPVGMGLCGIAASQRQALLAPDVTKDLRYINLNVATRSELAVPLIIKNRVIGVLDLESTRKGFFSGGHLQMMELLAPQIAVALENARLYEKLARDEARLERDLAAARELQLSLLPACCPEMPGLEISSRYEPAREIGGDLYHFVRHPGLDGAAGDIQAQSASRSAGSMLIFAGDVSGKGAPAALYAAMVSGLLQNVAEQPLAPGEMLEALNDTLLSRQIESRYLALTCVHCDLDTMTLEIGNAGLPHPTLCRKNEFIPVPASGVPLGLLPNMQYETEIVRLEPGDVLVLCSDGILDNQNIKGEEFGRDRLEDIICRNSGESASEIVELIIEHAAAWSVGRAAFDDMTVVVLKAVPRL